MLTIKSHLRKVTKLFMVVMLGLFLAGSLFIIFDQLTPRATAAPLAVGPTSVTQNITSTTTWTTADSPFIISGTIGLEAQLTIEPGVVVSFTQDSLLVALPTGQLLANGTTAQPIQFTGTPGTCTWQGVLLESDSNQIEYAHFEYASQAIYIKSSNSHQINNNTFENNGGCTPQPSPFSGAIIGFTDGTIFNQNVFTDNHTAIFLTRSGGNQISQNIISGTTVSAILFSPNLTTTSNSNVVSSNEIRNAGEYGIFMAKGIANSIEDNQIYSNVSGGIYVEDQTAVFGGEFPIRNNDVYSNTGPAVVISDTATLNLSDNLFYNNDEGVLWGLSNNSVLAAYTLEQNVVCNNAQYQFRNIDATTIEVTLDWWGSNTPTTGAVSSGSDIEGAVTISPTMIFTGTPAATALPADGVTTTTITISLGESGSTIPARARTVNLSTTLGTLSASQVTLDASGLATVTLTSAQTVGTAQITATEFCGFPITTEVEFQAADLGIAKTSSIRDITPGDLITYTIAYSNNANIAATNVVITDSLPTNLQFVSDNSASLGLSQTVSGNEIVWSTPSLPANAAEVLTLTTQLPTTATTTCGSILTNQVEITSTTVDGDPTNNQASHSGGVEVVCADVQLTKTSSISEVIPGQMITYTLAYTNAGNGTAENVLITDTLPGDVTWLTDTADALGLSRLQTTSEVVWQVGDVNAGTGETITLVGLVDTNATCASTLSNSAEATTTSFDSDLTNNSDTYSNTEVICIDLAITKTVLSAAQSVGKSTTFQIDYANVGFVTATNVVITDFLDTNVIYQSDTLGVTPVTGTNTVSWDLLNDIGPGESYTFTLDVLLDPTSVNCVGGTATFTNSTAIDSSQADIDETSNASAIANLVSVSCDPDLVIEKDDGLSGGTVLAGGLITYTLSYSNVGATDATNVVLTETLPANTSFVGPTGWTGGPSAYTYNLGTVISQTSGTVDFIVQVDPATTATAVTNTVTIGGSEADAATDDNEATEVTSITPAPDLSIEKLGLSTVAYPGDLVTYAITLTNQGSVTSTNIFITDTLPTGTSYYSNTVMGTPVSTSSTEVVWSVGLLAPAETTSFSLTVLAEAGTAICGDSFLSNTVEGRGAEAEGNYGNNVATTDATNSPTNVCQDVAITKTLTSPAVSFGKVSTFTLSYANSSVLTMTNVVITDVLDSNVNYVTDTLGSGVVGTSAITWSLGDLAPGSTGQFDIGFRLQTCPSSSYILTNTAQIGSGTADQNPSNDESIAQDVISCDEIDLVVVKNDGIGGLTEDPFVYAGEVFTYTISYNNFGNATATGVVITETLPAYTTFEGPVDANGWFSTGGDTYIYQPGDLAAMSGGKLEFAVRVVATLPATITHVYNVINVGANESDAVESDNQSQEQTPVVAIPDLVIEKESLTPVIRPNENVTYVITVTNQGNGSAHNVIITDTLPNHTSYVSDTFVFAHSDDGSGNISWSVGTLLSGDSRTFELTIVPDLNICDETTITNTVQVTALEPDFDDSNNVDTYDGSPPGCRDVAITKTTTTPQVALGNQVSFTLTYSNPGIFTATNTLVTDTLPAGLSFVDSNPTPTSQVGSEVEWSIGDLAPGLEGTIVLTTQSSSDLSYCDQILTNTGTITATYSGGVELYLDNNTSQADVEVRCLPDMTILKNDLVGGPTELPFVQAGDVFTYSILYSNIGVGSASNVVITETLPNHTSFSGPSGSNGWFQVGSTSEYTYSLGTVGSGSGGFVEFAVAVDNPLNLIGDPAFITNTVCIGSATEEATTGNNCSFEQTLVQSRTPRLDVVKTANPVSGSTVQPGDLITYTVSVHSTGEDIAQNVRLTDTLPSEVSFVTATLSTGGVVNGNSQLTADLGNILVGDAVTMTVVASVRNTAVSGTVFTNTAYSVANDSNVQQSNSVTHTVQSDVALTITKSANPVSGSTIAAGGLIDYMILVTNTSVTTQATAVMIFDTLPLSTTLVSSSTTHGSIINPNPLVVDVDVLGPGDVAQVDITVLVDLDIAQGSVISNTGEVNSLQTNLTFSDVVTHVVSGTTELEISKAATPASGSTVQPDDLITYTITISNLGSTSLSNVVVTDSLPMSTTFVSSDTVNGSVSGPDPLVFSLSSLAANQQETFTFTVQVDTAAISGTVISNTAFVDTDETVLDATNTVTHTIADDITATDLVVTKAATPASGSTVQSNDLIAYTITVSNVGGSALSNIVVTDSLPISTTFVSSDTLNGSVSGPDPLVFSLSSLAANQQETFTFTVQVDTAAISGTIINNLAQAVSDQTILTQTNEVTHTVTDVVTSSLVATKSATPVSGSTVQPDELITYTITVSNAGSTVLSNVVVTDSLPISTTFVSSDTLNGSVSGPDPLVFSLSSLGVGISETFTFTVQVDTAAISGTLISNTAQIVSDQTTLDQSNTVTHTVTDVLTSSLVTTKSAVPPSGSTVVPNELITYTIAVTNDGTSTLTNLFIADNRPISTTIVYSATSQGTLSGDDPVTALVSSLDPNQTVVLTLTAQVDSDAPAGLEIENFAQVDSNQTSLLLTNEVTHTVTNAVTSTLLASKAATPASGSIVAPDDLITYTITISNPSATDLTNVVVTDSLPISTTFVSSDILTGSVSGPDPLVFSISPIAANASETFTFTVRVDSDAANGTLISNTAEVMSDQSVVTTTNVVTHEVQDVNPDDLIAHKAATPPHGSIVQPNDLITYTVTVTNESSIALTNVMITDSLPANTSYQSFSATQGVTVGPDPITLNFGTVNSGATATLTFTVRVDSPVISGTIISNLAEIKSDQTPLTNTNVVTHLIHSDVITGLVALKSATPPHGSTVVPDELITYTVTVTNQGTADLTNVMVTDTIPSDTSFVSSDASQGVLTGPSPLVANFGTLPGGATATLTFTIQVDSSVISGTVISNVAEFISDQTTLSNTNVVTHLVGSTGPFTIFLPIIIVPPGTADATLTWVSQTQDRVQELDGNSGGLNADGQNDGEFLLTITVSPSSKQVDFVELVSDQSGSPTWDTVIDSDPVLGIYDGNTQLNDSDGTVDGLDVDTSVTVTLFASDDVGGTRFPEDTYNYTVYITFTDGTTATATARIPATPVTGIGWVTDVAADPTTNQIFVADPNQNVVHTIDGSSDVYNTSVSVGYGPTGLAVLTSTTPSKVFVAHAYALNNWTPGIWTIDSDDLDVRAMSDQGGYVGAAPVKIATNSNSGWERVYVSNYFDRLPILNGPAETRIGWVPKKSFQASYGIEVSHRTNHAYLASIDTGELIIFDGTEGESVSNYGACHHAPPEPRILRMVAVNQNTGHVFVTSPPDFNTGQTTSKVYVLDEALLLSETGGPPSDLTCTWNFLRTAASQLAIPGPAWVATIDLPGAISAGEEGIAVNSETNKVYVTDSQSDTLFVIDYDPTNNVANSVTSVTVGDNPVGVDVNQATHKVYVGNAQNSSASYGTVSVVDGDTDTVITTIPLTP